MVNIDSVDANRAAYNAVKIRINNPKANVTNPLETKNDVNSVNIEVNDPSVETEACKNCIYDYPEAKEPVTFDKTGLTKVNLPPIIPVYQQNFINNKAFIDNGFEFDSKSVKVPEPNITTTEEEKASPAFHGAQNKVEIVPPVEILPEVDVDSIVKNLESEDFDVQARQIDDIINTIIKEPHKSNDFIVKEIFSALIDITKVDSSALGAPNDVQKDLRKKFVKNLEVLAKAEAEGKPVKESELPYQLTKEEKMEALSLTPMEQAERNKDYAIMALAVLAKLYAEESEKQTGNVIPLTDLPGVSSIVDALRFSKNPEIKISAIMALTHINREEYKDELVSIFSIAANDENQNVAFNAAMALAAISGELK